MFDLKRRPKRIFRPERQVNKELKNYYHIDTYRNLSDSSFCFICVDHQTLELLHSLNEPQRYARWIDDYNGRQVRISKPEDEQFVDKLWARLQEQLADMACLDELTEVLREIAKSSRNSDLAMQLLVAQMRKDKTIYDVIPAPAPGGTLTVNNDSHFEAASLLETNGIAELFSVAMLDNGTLTLPDLNPFNLESKLDGIRTDINLSKTHFIGSFSQLVEWFATSFRGGLFSDYNPLGAETFFTRFTNTFNAATPTTVTVPVPWPPFTYTFTFYMVDKTFSERFTQAFFADDQREPTDSQNYFNRFNTKFDLFNVIHEGMKDCICAANGLLETIGSNILGISPTIDVATLNIDLSGVETQLGAISSKLNGVDKLQTVIERKLVDLINALEGSLGKSNDTTTIKTALEKIAQAISEIDIINTNILNTGETAYINVGDGCCEPPNGAGSGAGTGGYTPPSLDEPLQNEEKVPDSTICSWVEYIFDTLVSIFEWILWAMEWVDSFFGGKAVDMIMSLAVKSPMFMGLLVTAGLISAADGPMEEAAAVAIGEIIQQAVATGIPVLKSLIAAIKTSKSFFMSLFCDHRFEPSDIPNLLDDWIQEILKQIPNGKEAKKLLELIVKDDNVMRRLKYMPKKLIP